MKYVGKELSKEKALSKEWIITNGIGGFCSSSLIGANTRRYHGLLVAPINPPAKRHLVLSKLDESICINNKTYHLYTNVCNPDYISKGYKYLKSFEREYYPVYTYEVDGVTIEKTICMEYGKNIVIVNYKVLNKNVKTTLTLTPLINFRDFHDINTNHTYNIAQQVYNNMVTAVVDENYEHLIQMYASAGKYIMHNNDAFYNMQYAKEKERGFTYEENHAISGRYEIDIKPNEDKEITFVCSIEKDENIELINVKEVLKNEIKRIDKQVKQSKLLDDIKGLKKEELTAKEKLIQTYITASDNFIIKLENEKEDYYDLIAGFPWFLNWGRDTLIAFEGILLLSKRFDIAKKVLKFFTKNINSGLIPNGYSEYDFAPLYNSVDASLLYFEVVQKYIDYTGDYKFVEKEIYPYMEQIVEGYINGINIDNNNIYIDEDGLLVSGTKDTQNTWMDAKVDGVCITPRSGKAVEINSMWYNCLNIMIDLVDKFEKNTKSNNTAKRDKIKKYKDLSTRCKKSFEEKFYCKSKKTLYDVLSIEDDNHDDKIRPNQLYSLSLTYTVIDPTSEIAKNIISTVTTKLLNKNGLKTLAKSEVGYSEVYEGSSSKRDSMYHQGIVWPWLLGLYYNSLNIMARKEKNKDIKRDLLLKLKEFKMMIGENFTKEMTTGNTIGNISEIYDAKSPYYARGAFAQCWSIAEVFRIIFS